MAIALLSSVYGAWAAQPAAKEQISPSREPPPPAGSRQSPDAQQKPPPDSFEPTEKISADSAISFPVDI